jgi:two-component system cell cycle sensor histidine kinase/response regulator CckA
VTYLLAAVALLCALQSVALLWVLRLRRDERLRAQERVRLEHQTDRLQQQFERAGRLESIGQLAGGVAHDFNNQLAVIVNYTSLILHDMPSEDPHREDLAEIRRAAEQARDLTDRLMLFSRRDTELPEVVDVAEALDAVHHLLRRAIGADIELDIMLAGDLLPVSLGAGQLEQVLLHLALNAREAMPGGGRLDIVAENGQLSDGSSCVRLVVRDDGSGMRPAAAAASAFDPFFTTKSADQGPGLGLATTHGIVMRAGGAVALESAPGEGTTVTVELPAGQAPPQPPTLRAVPQLVAAE